MIENKEHKEYKVSAAKALELLARLERENPSPDLNNLYPHSEHTT